MKGSSRIGGSGFYGGHGGFSRGEERGGARERFRRNVKAGDVVSGVFLRFENERFGWAFLEGEELLALLPAGGPRPKEGERVFFRVEALAPELVLRMLPSSDAAARLSLALPPAPLSQEAALYLAARDALDALLAGEENFRRASGAEAEKAFVKAVAANARMAAAFAESLARSRRLARAASSAGLLFFRHMPWLCPRVRALEVSLWAGEGPPVVAGATLPSGDRLLLSGMLEKGAFRHQTNVTPAPGSPASGAKGGAADVVERILAGALRTEGAAVGRFSRTL